MISKTYFSIFLLLFAGSSYAMESERPNNLIESSLATSNFCGAMNETHRFTRVNEITGDIEHAFRDYYNAELDIGISCLPLMHIAEKELYEVANEKIAGKLVI